MNSLLTIKHIWLVALLGLLMGLGACQNNSGSSKSETEIKFDQQVRDWVSKGGDLNQISSSIGESPLYSASRMGYIDSVEQLLSHGADAKTVNVGMTPLHGAMYNTSSDETKVLKITEMLVQHGADVNARNENQQTPLAMAAEFGLANVCELLVKDGADVNASDRVGETALHRASAGGYSKIVTMLISHGADVNAKGIGATPLTWCQKRSNEERYKNDPRRDYPGTIKALQDHGAR